MALTGRVTGDRFVVKHAGSGTENFMLGTGPVYALFDSYGNLD